MVALFSSNIIYPSNNVGNVPYNKRSFANNYNRNYYFNFNIMKQNLTKKVKYQSCQATGNIPYAVYYLDENDLKQGLCELYHENSIYLKFKGNYEDDELDGGFVSFYENGNVKYKGTYKKGKLEGSRVKLDKDGFTEDIEIYKNGELITIL